MSPARRSATPAWALPLGLAVLAILIRLPFLLRGDAFFNSDEALEGLMARHIGDLPIFFWGQGYKGVPEVYLAALVFAIFGAGVVPLKAVTLAIWAAAVAANTRLGQRWYGDAGGAFAGGLLAVGTPSVMYWSLAANAEVAWLTLTFAVVLLAYDRSIDPAAPGRRTSPIVPIGCGFAMWIHPVALPFVGALAIVAGQRSPWWRTHGWRGFGDLLLGRDARGVAKLVILSLHVMALALAAVFVWTYLGGRISAGIVTAAHPQKEFRLLVVTTGLAIVAHGLAGGLAPARRVLAMLGWFACGLLPVVVFVLRGDGVPGSLITVHRIADLPRLADVFVRVSLPMFLGLRDLNTAWSAAVWTAVPLVAALVLQAIAATRACVRDAGRTAWQPSTAVPLVIALLLVVMLGPGGAFDNINSYRYLMPFFGLTALCAAGGVAVAARRSRVAAALIAAGCVCAGAVWDLRWFNGLRADDSDRQIIACLNANGVGAASADYWIAYRLTFRAGEDPIVDVDRGGPYPPYREAVRAAPRRVVIRYAGGDAARGTVLCTAPGLEAVVADPPR